MSVNLLRDEIIKHALTIEENFRVAMEVGLAFPELRNQVIIKFAQKIKNTLEEPEQGYSVDTSWWENEPTGSFTGMTCREKSWPEGIEICIEAQQAGIRKYIIGVGCKKNTINDQLWQKIYIDLGVGKQSNGWIWYEDLKEDYRNFDNPKTLIALYKQTDMLDYLIKRIKEIEQIISKALLPCDTQ